MLEDVILWYGLIALMHIFNQINFGHMEYLRSRREQFDENFAPSVLVVIPCYNEGLKELDECVSSVLGQRYNGKLDAVLVDDGSLDKTAFKFIKRKHGADKRLFLEEFGRNKGKRHAHKHAFDLFDKKYEVVVTIDSDTRLRHDAIANLVQKFKDKRIGAVTGDVRAVRTPRFLSHLIDLRYWTAFNQERAAQSLFGTVLCCSGPLSAYRTSVIRMVKDKYISQKFLGQHCTYGDDRHLTNLVLSEGYQVRFEPKAKAKTGVPQTIGAWIKQQIRWNRSFYRELIWTFKMVIKRPLRLHPYILYDITMQALLPFLLFLSLLFMAFRALSLSPFYFVLYLVVLTGIALLRGTYAILRTGDKSFFMFPFYAVLHIFLLIPVRLYALTTLGATKWGTR